MASPVLWLVLVALAGRSAANVNIWISKEETRPLLGLATEIFYVQEGVVNKYAMNFTVIVPPNITDLHFNWRRTSRKAVPYSAVIEVSNPALLQRPSFNIPPRGFVPYDHEIFTVHLPCRPGATGETDVRLKITLQLPRQPSLGRKKTTEELVFRRTRVCRTKVTRTLAPRGGDQMQDDAPGPTRVSDPPAKDSEQESSGVLYIAIGSACGVVLVIIIILAVALSRNKASRRRKRALSELSEEYEAANHYMQVPIASHSNNSIRSSHHYATLRPLPTCPSYTSQKTVTTPLDPTFGQTEAKVPHGGAYGFTDALSSNISQAYNNFNHSSGHSTGSSSGPRTAALSTGQRSACSSGPRVRDVGERVSELMVDRRRVELETVLQEGTFGRIASGWVADPDRGEKERVVIKTVSECASQAQVSRLLQEGLVFYGLRHKNLLSVLGVAIEDRTPPLVLYPHVKHWNLKKYLQTCSFGSRSDVRTLTVRDVVDLAEQLTQALLFLHLQNICHSDIAARNCCIDDSLHVRLSDSALSRDLFPNDYCCLADNINRPIKWMAMEAILTNQYTPASDMWSLGVLLWELTTLAQQPYVEVDPFEMASFLDEGYRLAKPLNCPDSLFSVMAYCWSREPEERPSAEQALDYLHRISKQISHYV